MKNLSIAVLALLSIISPSEAISMESQAKSEALSEATRYIGSNGEPVNLAQTN